MAARASSAASTLVGTPGARIPPFASHWRREHLTVNQRVARAGAPVLTRHGRVTASGSPRRTGRTQLPCLRNRRRHGYRRWFRSGTGGCWSRPSPFTGARP